MSLTSLAQIDYRLSFSRDFDFDFRRANDVGQVRPRWGLSIFFERIAELVANLA